MVRNERGRGETEGERCSSNSLGWAFQRWMGRQATGVCVAGLGVDD